MTKDNHNQSKNISPVFADYARYYDLLYRDKDYEVETDYVVKLIQRFHPQAKSVLELGSGTGTHAMNLVKRGYDITGVEISPDMLNIALTKLNNKPSSNPLFIEGDIRNIHLNRIYDAVLSLFHVISYQTTNEDVTAAFETTRKHLKPGGIFIFDVWYGPAVLTERPEVRKKQMTGQDIEVTRLASPLLRYNENIVDVNYHIFLRNLTTRIVSELEEIHSMRYFFKPEIEYLASRTGFIILHSEEWLSGKPIGNDTWSACFCLRAA